VRPALIFDGYDLFIYGVVLPSIMKEWGLTPLQAGALGSYALFGMMFGALASAAWPTASGARRASPSVSRCSRGHHPQRLRQQPSEFGIYRFFAGLGCGGLMPNAVALMNEYAPKRLRSTLVAIMFSGYSLGGMLGRGWHLHAAALRLGVDVLRRRRAAVVAGDPLLPARIHRFPGAPGPYGGGAQTAQTP
jgi:AAHS family benzoate transporter-like MFS transporter